MWWKIRAKHYSRVGEHALNFLQSEWNDISHIGKDWYSHDTLRSLAFSSRNVTDYLQMSRATTHRVIHWLLDNGYIIMCDVSDWRPNAKRHYYMLTPKAIKLFYPL